MTSRFLVLWLQQHHKVPIRNKIDIPFDSNRCGISYFSYRRLVLFTDCCIWSFTRTQRENINGIVRTPEDGGTVHLENTKLRDFYHVLTSLSRRHIVIKLADIYQFLKEWLQSHIQVFIRTFFEAFTRVLKRLHIFCEPSTQLIAFVYYWEISFDEVTVARHCGIRRGS